MLKIFFLIPTSQREKEKGKKLPIFHHIIISIINTMMMMKIRNNLQCLVLLLLSHIFLWLTSTKIKMKKPNETKQKHRQNELHILFSFFFFDMIFQRFGSFKKRDFFGVYEIIIKISKRHVV